MLAGTPLQMLEETPKQHDLQVVKLQYETGVKIPNEEQSGQDQTSSQPHRMEEQRQQLYLHGETEPQQQQGNEEGGENHELPTDTAGQALPQPPAPWQTASDSERNGRRSRNGNGDRSRRRRQRHIPLRDLLEIPSRQQVRGIFVTRANLRGVMAASCIPLGFGIIFTILAFSIADDDVGHPVLMKTLHGLRLVGAACIGVSGTTLLHGLLLYMAIIWRQRRQNLLPSIPLVDYQLGRSSFLGQCCQHHEFEMYPNHACPCQQQLPDPMLDGPRAPSHGPRLIPLARGGRPVLFAPETSSVIIPPPSYEETVRVDFASAHGAVYYNRVAHEVAMAGEREMEATRHGVEHQDEQNLQSVLDQETRL